MDASPLTYESAEAVYAELERLRAAGVLPDQAYRTQLNALRIKDDRGRTWMLQERTGRWHVWERGAWTEGTPPGREQAPEAAGEVPPEVATPAVTPIASPEATGSPFGAPASLPPPGSLPPPPPDVTGRLPGAEPGARLLSAPDDHAPPVSAVAVPPPPAQPGAAASAASYTPPPAPVLPPPSAQRAVPPPPTVPPPAALAANTLTYMAQPLPGRAGKRARRDAQRATRAASRSRRGFRYIAWSIFKWDILWCLVAWAVSTTVGGRAPWALIPVAALALLTLVLWIRGLPRRQPQGAR